MAMNPDQAWIQLPHGGLAPSPLKRMVCPICPKASEQLQFAEDDALFDHVATAHPARRFFTWDSSERQKLIDEGERAAMQDASSPESPTRSASRTSADSRVARQSSVRVEPPASRSPSISGEPDPQPHSKRPFQDDLEYPQKQSGQPKLKQFARQSRRNAPSGILPEDVDPSFKRTPMTVPERTARKPLSPRRTFDPGPGRSPTAAPTAAIAEVAPKATGSSGSSHAGLAPSSNSPQTTSRRPSALIRRPLGLKLRYSAKWPTLILEPESKDISQEQLAAEVKSIYSGLNMVENRCIHLDKAEQNIPRGESNISDEHWQAMIALHRTLLHEHHDFLLASQHPSASPALKRLALKYSMPSRMWKHGMHSFLELLRHRLPESLEYMLAFINLAYQMMTLLYDTIRSFRNTWIECLGDLGRYRMAVEDDDQPERETWAGVARSWYNQAADTNPAIGRFFHHLAILARPDMVQQLYLYHRSLTSIISFTNARESIVTVFEPILSEKPPLPLPVSHTDAALIKVHALLFKRQDLEVVGDVIETYIQSLPYTIDQEGDKWRQVSTFTAIANIGCLFDFGSESSPLRFLFDMRRKILQQQDPNCVPPGLPADQPVPDIQSMPHVDSTSEQAFEHAVNLLMSTFKVALSRNYDPNVMPLVHCIGVFLLNLSHISASMSAPYVGDLLAQVPWSEMVSLLNTLAKTQDNIDESYKTSILFGERPLPEDWMMRGLSWTFGYFHLSWFKDATTTEEEERYMERTSTVKARVDRIMSIAVQLAKIGDKIAFDPNINRFNVVGQDVPMLDDDDEDMHEDSREMNDFRERLEHQEQDGDQECVETLSTHYGKVVLNLDILRQTDVVNIILDKSNMAMIIPHECMTTLLESANSQELSSNESAAALSNLRNALNGYKNITIQDTKGEDLTRFYVGSQAVAFLDQGQRRHQLSTTPLKEDDEVIHTLDAVARQNSDLDYKMSRATTQIFSRTTTGITEATDLTDYDDDMGPDAFPASFSPPNDRPAVVITDDRKVRAEVGKLGSAAIAGWMIKKLLMTKKARSRQSDPVNRMNVDQPVRRSPAA